jgi:ubiquinone/menaquinone biosynthesis C-methylase UbiE
MDPSNKYTVMQRQQYESDATNWNLHNLDPVVGSFMAHNSWSDYDFLFKDIDNLNDKKILDFGCGPGRNLVKYNDIFKNIDGVDISVKNLENARMWLQYNNKNADNTNLFLCNGVDLNIIQNEQYDVVMSTICMQHICVYDIRLNYFKEFFRILKTGGYITIQMGYGKDSPLTVDYYSNHYDAKSTNRGCDVCISDYKQIEKDLLNIGFKNFKYYIRPVGPGDIHPNWIFFSAQK